MNSENTFSSLNLLLDSVEGPNLLLEYFNNISKRLFQAKDFKSILNTLYEELKRIYIKQNIEILIWHNGTRLVRFTWDETKGRIVPSGEIHEKYTLYGYVIEKCQPLLTNNYQKFCDNLELNPTTLPASSWLGIPMVVKGKVLGAIVIWDENPERYLRIQDKQFLNIIADIVSFAIENIYLYDYIAEKNGSYKIFESILPRGSTRNSIKSVINQLLKSVNKHATVQYSGIFMRSKHHQNWRMVNEVYETPNLSQLGIDLIKHFPQIPENLFDKAEFYYWHKDYVSHPFNSVFQDLLAPYSINAALVFPFVVNQSYLGLWVTCFQRGPEQLSPDETQLYRFIFYIMTQLIEKKALIERKQRYEMYMKHLERMKQMGELASSAAHHLNNIFSVILGKAQLLQRKIQGSTFDRDLELIIQAAEDGALSVRRLQNARQAKSNEPLKPINLNDIVQEVVEIARPRFEEEAQSRGIHYDLNLTLGRVGAVLGDAAELREVILNLINNALDAMPGGGKLSIQTTRKDNNALIFVSDTGKGIPQELQEKIFEPFFTTKGKKGNGLGLSIAVEIIQRHRGKIYVDSIPNKGTIFMIELPLISHDNQKAFTPHEFLGDLHYKVLLVDDEGIVRETLAEMLEEEGCEVTTASNAEEAVLKFQKYRCDVVLTDLSMPGMNGIELARRIKQLDAHTPIFIITGWNQMDKKLLNANKFIDGVIQKPFNMELIRQELERVVNGNGRPQS